MDTSNGDFFKKVQRLKSQIESDLRFEFLNYLENLKVQDQVTATTARLGDQIKSAIRTLPSAPFSTSQNASRDIGDQEL